VGTGEEGNGTEPREVVRLSVVLSEELDEHVRLRAFQTRTSRSAYVRALVDEDRRHGRPAIDASRR
jgi:hypothetical protein